MSNELAAKRIGDGPSHPFAPQVLGVTVDLERDEITVCQAQYRIVHSTAARKCGAPGAIRIESVIIGFFTRGSWSKEAARSIVFPGLLQNVQTF